MISDHFDGKRFFTPGAPPVKGFRDVLRWMLTRTPAKWMVRNPAAFSPSPALVENGRLRVVFVNHSTVLIQVNGVNILTDPIWSDRASPLPFVGPKRFSSPGIPLDKLPPIHIVLLSHNHYDHMDLPTLRRIQRDHAPRVYVPLRNRKYLQAAEMDHATELDWWDAASYSTKLTIHCTPAQHFSGRGMFDRNRALWCSWVIETPSGNVYFGADTGFGPHVRQIKNRFGDFRLALLPIGAYEPRWFMSPVHISPEEAVQAHEILDPDVSVGIHFGTFALADEPQFAAEQRIRQFAAEKQLNFRLLQNGEPLEAEVAKQTVERIG